MNCPQCQYALSPFDKSCPRCAQMQTAQTTTAVAPAPRTAPVPAQRAVPAHEPAGCVAGGNPAVQKVSGLYRGGVWSASSVGVGVGYGRTSGGQSFTTVSTASSETSGSTQLATLLAPPPKPQNRATNSQAMLGFCVFMSVVFGLLSFVPDGGTTFRWIAIPCIIGTVVFLPLAIKSGRDKRRDYRIMLQSWQAVGARWEFLYYCPRCDRVFNPLTGRAVASHALPSTLINDMLSGTSTL